MIRQLCVIVLFGGLVTACGETRNIAAPTVVTQPLVTAVDGSPVLTATKVDSIIVVHPGSNLVVLGSVSFDTTIGSLPGSVDPAFVYVQIRLYQGTDNVLVWSQTAHPDFVFPLGNGQPTSCDGNNVCHGYGFDNFAAAHGVADLFYWSNGGKYVVLASTMFEVAGQ